MFTRGMGHSQLPCYENLKLHEGLMCTFTIWQLGSHASHVKEPSCMPAQSRLQKICQLQLTTDRNSLTDSNNTPLGHHPTQPREKISCYLKPINFVVVHYIRINNWNTLLHVQFLLPNKVLVIT